jgi:hypothetical protein
VRVLESDPNCPWDSGYHVAFSTAGLEFRLVALEPLWMAVDNAGFIQIVGGHFHIHFVAHGNADKILAHFAGDMGKDFMAVGQRDAEHCAREHLRHVSH